MSYSKLHSSVVNSSLWTQPDNVRILFITLLAMCDRNGYVYGSRPGIERLANIGADPKVDPWNVLMSTDRHSSDRLRNPENEGRRIEEVPGGYRLLNFEYYRGLRNDDDRKEQGRIAQSKHRSKLQSAKVSQSKPRSAKVSQSEPISEAEAEADKGGTGAARFPRPAGPAEVEDFCESLGLPRSDGSAMFLHWEEKGWAKVKDWKLTIRKWKSFGYLPSQKSRQSFKALAAGKAPGPNYKWQEIQKNMEEAAQARDK